MISTQFCPVCGAANELAHTRCFACGQLLATSRDGRAVRDAALLHERYQLGASLGAGGFSAVYRARDVQSGREVAIKQVMLGGLSADETIQATDTFNRELSLLSALHLGSSVAERELIALAQRMRSPAPSERPATVRDVATALEAIRQARLTQDEARIWRPPTPQDLPALAGGQRALQLPRPEPPGTSSFAPASRRVGRREVLIGLGVLAAAVAGGGIWRTHTPPSPPPPYLYRYQGHAEAVTAVAWSPDGGRIASGSVDKTVQVWNAL